MKDWIKKYKLIILTVAIIIVFSWPLIVNWLYNIETDCEVLHKPQEWTIFWGSYIGSIVSAAVAFIILHIQSKKNEEENEKNREENEKNRILQLKILEQQQEMQWLNTFKQASGEYLSVLSYNEIIYIINISMENPREALNLIKTQIDKTNAYEMNFKFIGAKGDYNKLISSSDTLFKLYMEVLNDIQTEISFLISFNSSCFNDFCNALMSPEGDGIVSEAMKQKISNFNYNANFRDKDCFFRLALERVNDLKPSINEIKDIFGEYIKTEQKRIERITTEI